MSDRSPSSPSMPSLMPEFDFGILLEANRRAFDRWTRGVFACSRELSAFCMARLNQDLEAWKALAGTTSLEELMQRQSGYLQKASADYLEATRKLAGLMMEAAASLSTETSRPAPPAQTWSVAPAGPASPQQPPSRAPSVAPTEAPVDLDG